MTPSVLKDRKGFPAFREQVKVYAKFNRFESVLTTESPADVGSEERDVLLRRGVSSVTYDRHVRAWVFFSMAFELPTDIGRFSRSTSPRQFWENTVKYKFVLSRVLLMAYSSILLEYVLDSTYS